MVRMTDHASPLNRDQWKSLDTLVKRADEDRWLSSRYAPSNKRRSLVALYAYNYELAKVRTSVSEPGLGAIRFQWWRDALDEIDAGDMTRKHDVALALNELITSNGFSALVARRMLDAHEAAFENSERSKEPEALLMSAAANQLAATHAWGQNITQLAPAYAAARRGDTKAFGPVVPKVPGTIRPALAHAALRYNYASGIAMKPFAKRLMIMRAMFSGKV